MPIKFDKVLLLLVTCLLLSSCSLGNNNKETALNYIRKYDVVDVDYATAYVNTTTPEESISENGKSYILYDKNREHGVLVTHSYDSQETYVLSGTVSPNEFSINTYYEEIGTLRITQEENSNLDLLIGLEDYAEFELINVVNAYEDISNWAAEEEFQMEKLNEDGGIEEEQVSDNRVVSPHSFRSVSYNLTQYTDVYTCTSNGVQWALFLNGDKTYGSIVSLSVIYDFEDVATGKLVIEDSTYYLEDSLDPNYGIHFTLDSFNGESVALIDLSDDISFALIHSDDLMSVYNKCLNYFDDPTSKLVSAYTPNPNIVYTQAWAGDQLFVLTNEDMTYARYVTLGVSDNLITQDYEGQTDNLPSSLNILTQQNFFISLRKYKEEDKELNLYTGSNQHLKSISMDAFVLSANQISMNTVSSNE